MATVSDGDDVMLQRSQATGVPGELKGANQENLVVSERSSVESDRTNVPDYVIRMKMHKVGQDLCISKR